MRCGDNSAACQDELECWRVQSWSPSVNIDSKKVQMRHAECRQQNMVKIQQHAEMQEFFFQFLNEYIFQGSVWCQVIKDLLYIFSSTLVFDLPSSKHFLIQFLSFILDTCFLYESNRLLRTWPSSSFLKFRRWFLLLDLHSFL